MNDNEVYVHAYIGLSLELMLAVSDICTGLYWIVTRTNASSQ